MQPKPLDVAFTMVFFGLLICSPVRGESDQVDPTKLVCEDLLLQSSNYYVQPLVDLYMASDINDEGIVVGSAGFIGRIYEDHSYVDYQVPGAPYTVLWSINNQRQLGGSYSPPGSDYVGFMANEATIETIDFPGAYRTEVTGVADTGDVTGIYKIGILNRTYGFLKPSHASYIHLEVPGAEHTLPNSVNNSLDVVGSYWDWSDALGAWVTHGFVYSAGGYSIIDVPGALHTEAIDIGNDGTIYGIFVRSDGTKGVFTKSGTDYLTRDHHLPGAPYSPMNWAQPHSATLGWNNSGQIVGRLRCFIEPELPYTRLMGYLATPALRPEIQLFPSNDSLDLSKKNPLMIALISSAEFDATAVVDSVVLLPRGWIWHDNYLEGGTPPLRYIVLDVNHDRIKDVLFQFSRDDLRRTDMNVVGVMLKGTTDSGQLFVGIQLLEILNQWPN